MKILDEYTFHFVSRTALLITHCRDLDFGISTLNLGDRGREVIDLHYTFSFAMLFKLLYCFSPVLLSVQLLSSSKACVRDLVYNRTLAGHIHRSRI